MFGKGQMKERVPFLTRVRREGNVFGNVSAGADREHFGGGGALQVGNLRLVEDSSERSGTLVSDPVLLKTVSEVRSENGG